MLGLTITSTTWAEACSRRKEDEEVTIARAEREKAANDPVIQDLARRLGMQVHFLLDYRERVVGQFGPRLDRSKDQKQSLRSFRLTICLTF